MKRTDAQIFIMAHKPVDYDIPDNVLYTPVQVGSNPRFLKVRDNDREDSISEFNPFYAEGTGIYYVWKHFHPTKYKGVCQYRRRLEFDEGTDFDEIFRDYDMVVATPIYLPGNVRGQFEKWHCKEDLDRVENIVKTFYPDYSEDWDRWINNGQFLFYSNGFIMRSEHYDQYAEWLFSVLGKFREGEQWDTAEQLYEEIERDIESGKRPNDNGKGSTEGAVKYQAQKAGFLGERLLTLWILHNIPLNRIMLKDYRKYENV